MDGVDRLDAYMHLHGSDVAIQTLAWSSHEACASHRLDNILIIILLLRFIHAYKEKKRKEWRDFVVRLVPQINGPVPVSGVAHIIRV